MGYMIELSEKPHAIAKWEHKVNKNWKVAAVQSYNMNHVGKDKGSVPDAYQVGFDVNYTL